LAIVTAQGMSSENDSVAFKWYPGFFKLLGAPELMLGK
jgi:hypothetical protein